MPQINYYIRAHYGTEHRYPIEHKEALKLLTGRSTLTDTDLEALKMLGYELTEVVKPKEPIQ